MQPSLYDLKPGDFSQMNQAAHPGGGTTTIEVPSGEGVVEDQYEAHLRGLHIAYQEPVLRTLASLAAHLDEREFEVAADFVDGLMSKFAQDAAEEAALMAEVDQPGTPEEMLQQVKADVESLNEIITANFPLSEGNTSAKRKIQLLVSNLKQFVETGKYREAYGQAIRLQQLQRSVDAEWFSDFADLFAQSSDYAEFQAASQRVFSNLRALLKQPKAPAPEQQDPAAAEEEMRLKQQSRWIEDLRALIQGAERRGQIYAERAQELMATMADKETAAAFEQLVQKQTQEFSQVLQAYHQIKQAVSKMQRMDKETFGYYEGPMRRVLKTLDYMLNTLPALKEQAEQTAAAKTPQEL